VTVNSCPVGAWPISLSTWDGGWLLVCGTSASQPTYLAYSDGSQASESESVDYGNGGYCADTPVGRVCAYHAPALVTVTSDAGDEMQHSVADNYFADSGAGGAGEGTGSYGVEAPEDTDQDQVRYLLEILQKSMQGRSDIDRAVSQVRNCENLSESISTMEGVEQNRVELLQALDSTPFDRIPNGAALVSSLRHALELSRDSDRIWVEWARSEEANGCAAGRESSFYKEVQAKNVDVAAAKSYFTDLWNSQIAPVYSVPSFAVSEI
jgi:hypothetical protein